MPFWRKQKPDGSWFIVGKRGADGIVRPVWCDECPCEESSSSSSSHSAVSDCDLCPDGAPAVYRISDFSGVTNGECQTCEDTFAAAFHDLGFIGIVGGFCTWEKLFSEPSPGCGAPTSCQLTRIRLIFNTSPSGNKVVVSFFNCTDFGSGPQDQLIRSYSISPSSFECLGVNELTFDTDQQPAKCQGWPATITVEPAP